MRIDYTIRWDCVHRLTLPLMALFRVWGKNKISLPYFVVWVSNIQHRLKFSIQKLYIRTYYRPRQHRLGFCWDACFKTNECVLQGEPRCLVYLQFFKGWKTKFKIFCQNKITPASVESQGATNICEATLPTLSKSLQSHNYYFYYYHHHHHHHIGISYLVI